MPAPSNHIRGVTMRSAVKKMSTQAKNRVFATLFTLCFLMAVFPPFYLWGSGADPEILGLPFAVVYMLFDALLLALGVWALYWIEDVRGELD